MQIFPQSSRCAVVVGASLFCSCAAWAGPLIAFNDASPSSGTTAPLSDTGDNWAVSWTQTVDSSNVTLSALLAPAFRASTATPAWYVTTAIGPNATAADVVHSGKYNPSGFGSGTFNFDLAPRTVLGTGLNFSAGTYYLVLDGPDDGTGQWLGDSPVTTTLASGFSLGSYYGTNSAAAFAPAGNFDLVPSSANLVFEMESIDPGHTIALPSTLALAVLGLAGLGLARRRAG